MQRQIQLLWHKDYGILIHDYNFEFSCWRHNHVCSFSLRHGIVVKFEVGVAFTYRILRAVDDSKRHNNTFILVVRLSGVSASTTASSRLQCSVGYSLYNPAAGSGVPSCQQDKGVHYAWLSKFCSMAGAFWQGIHFPLPSYSFHYISPPYSPFPFLLLPSSSSSPTLFFPLSFSPFFSLSPPSSLFLPLPLFASPHLSFSPFQSSSPYLSRLCSPLISRSLPFSLSCFAPSSSHFLSFLRVFISLVLFLSILFSSSFLPFSPFLFLVCEKRQPVESIHSLPILILNDFYWPFAFGVKYLCWCCFITGSRGC